MFYTIIAIALVLFGVTISCVNKISWVICLIVTTYSLFYCGVAMETSPSIFIIITGLVSILIFIGTITFGSTYAFTKEKSSTSDDRRQY